MCIRQAQFPADQEALVALVREYAAWLKVDMCLQNFDEEMAHIDSKYSLPNGLFWVVEDAGRLVGGVGFKHLNEATAEVKRLYVQPAFRGHALGQKLMHMVICTTRQLGYQRLVLDTVPQTAGSHVLYQHLGFTPTAPYYSGPTFATHFFALPLQPSH